MVDLNLKDVKFKDYDGQIIDFGDVQNTEDLKNKILYEMEFPYCKNCGFTSECKHYDSSRGDNCGLLSEVLSNYIDMNIKSIDYANEYLLVDFIKSCFYFIKFSNDFLNLIGIYSDKEFNWYFESMHPSMNKIFSHKVLINLSKYLDSSRNVNTKRVKKFNILVEGESDKIFISGILKGLGLYLGSGIKDNIQIIILGSSSRAKLDKLKDHLQRFREADVDFFLFLDGDAKDKSEELLREGLMKKEDVVIFDKDIEDEIPVNELINKIESIRPELEGSFNFEDIEKEKQAGKKTIKKILEDSLYLKGKSLDFNSIKIELANAISEEVEKELKESTRDERGTYCGDITPHSEKYSELVEKIRPISNSIKKISTDFFVVKK